MFIYIEQRKKKSKKRTRNDSNDSDSYSPSQNDDDDQYSENEQPPQKKHKVNNDDEMEPYDEECKHTNWKMSKKTMCEKYGNYSKKFSCIGCNKLMSRKKTFLKCEDCGGELLHEGCLKTYRNKFNKDAKLVLQFL